jgi:asparagine synthase (glutamine-hydrolysing)
VKVDRMSMAHSLEVRSPFLDHRLVEFVWNLPPRLKLDRGQTKVILRKLLRDRLPKPTLRKRKQGFNVPLREWFRGEVGLLAADYLLGRDGLPSEAFDRGAVASLLGEHRDGRADHSEAIWLLLSYATWRQHRAVPSSSATSRGAAPGASRSPVAA